MFERSRNSRMRLICDMRVLNDAEWEMNSWRGEIVERWEEEMWERRGGGREIEECFLCFSSSYIFKIFQKKNSKETVQKIYAFKIIAHGTSFTSFPKIAKCLWTIHLILNSKTSKIINLLPSSPHLQNPLIRINPQNRFSLNSAHPISQAKIFVWKEKNYHRLKKKKKTKNKKTKKKKKKKPNKKNQKKKKKKI